MEQWSALASPPACKPMKPMGWKRARSLRLGERDSVLRASSGRIAWIIVKNGHAMISVWAGNFGTIRVPSG
jgi:hypothetical protein